MPVEKRGADEDDSPWAERKPKRKSRWAKDESDKTFIPGMPTSLPADATEDQKEQYLLQLQIEDISRRLRSGELGIPQNIEDRSPSPEPIYNSEGKRMNTRDYRVRRRLEEERHEHVKKLVERNPAYKPPSDYKPPVIRVHDRVAIPQDDHPEINFVGLLIGPRGNTLKNLEKDTGAKIIIRGKGSVKEGKIGRKDGQPLPGEDEPLHAYITASNPENVQRAVSKIKEIIQQGIEVPEEQNDLRKKQLRELALLNGTLREDEGLMKLRQLAEAQTIITNTITCSICGGAGHISKDCMQRRQGDSARGSSGGPDGAENPPGVPFADRAKMDSEYMSLMAELGQSIPGPPPPMLRGPGRMDSRMSLGQASSGQLSSNYGYGGPRRLRFERDPPFQLRSRMPFHPSGRPMQAIMAPPLPSLMRPPAPQQQLPPPPPPPPPPQQPWSSAHASTGQIHAPSHGATGIGQGHVMPQPPSGPYGSAWHPGQGVQQWSQATAPHHPWPMASNPSSGGYAMPAPPPPPPPPPPPGYGYTPLPPGHQ